MNWLDRFGAKKGCVGIEVLPDGLAVAARGCSKNSSDFNVVNMLAQGDDGVGAAQMLAEFVAKQGLERRLCNLVLSQKDYQLLLVEAPEVPDDELREAVRWRIKDLASVPVDSAALDVFALPGDASRSGKKMLYVVVAAKDRIQKMVDLVNGSALLLAAIDIPELALRNISLIAGDDEMQTRGIGIVRLRDNGGSVALYRQGNLYLSRQFTLNYGGGLLDDIPSDALALEVQRSLDYYERQMGLSPPATLYLCGENVSADKITQDLTRALTVPIQFLDLAQALGAGQGLDSGMAHLCVGAIGGVLRDQVRI